MTQSNSREKLENAGVSKQVLDTIESSFREDFRSVYDEHDIKVTEEIVSDAVSVLFDIIFEFGKNEDFDATVVSYAKEIADEYSGEQHSRTDVFFVSGRAAAEYSDSELATVSKKLRASEAKKKYSDRSP